MSKRKIHYCQPNAPITKHGDSEVICKRSFSRIIMLKTGKIPKRIWDFGIDSFTVHKTGTLTLKTIFATTDHEYATCKKCRKLM